MKAMTTEAKTAAKENTGKKTSRASMSARTRELAMLGLLTAIMFIMAFTPIGYLNVPPLSITFMTVPVIVSAAILRPRDSAIIGGVFGLTSFIQALNGASALTSALLQVNPVFTFILCFVPRILEGFLGGLIFTGMKKIDKTNVAAYGVTSLAVPVMNTIFFMSTLFILFYNSEPIRKIAEAKGAENVFALLIAMVGTNAVIEAVVCFVIGTAITKALAVALKRVSK